MLDAYRSLGTARDSLVYVYVNTQCAEDPALEQAHTFCPLRASPHAPFVPLHNHRTIENARIILA